MGADKMGRESVERINASRPELPSTDEETARMDSLATADQDEAIKRVEQALAAARVRDLRAADETKARLQQARIDWATAEQDSGDVADAERTVQSLERTFGEQLGHADGLLAGKIIMETLRAMLPQRRKLLQMIEGLEKAKEAPNADLKQIERDLKELRDRVAVLDSPAFLEELEQDGHYQNWKQQRAREEGGRGNRAA